MKVKYDSKVDAIYIEFAKGNSCCHKSDNR